MSATQEFSSILEAVENALHEVKGRLERTRARCDQCGQEFFRKRARRARGGRTFCPATNGRPSCRYAFWTQARRKLDPKARQTP